MGIKFSGKIFENFGQISKLYRYFRKTILIVELLLNEDISFFCKQKDLHEGGNFTNQAISHGGGTQYNSQLYIMGPHEW